ncbi:MAG TPA: MAC/perforin domain-containing protein [Aquella sp.]|nr:MAC/perforin domain-containing protein [Aquella sp.]
MFFILFYTVIAFEPAPITNILGNGFDFKTGTYSLAPVFEYTYDSKMTWTTPYSKKTYSVPDQMFLHSADKTFESVISHVSASFTEFYEKFVREYSFTIGIETGIVGFGFKFDKQLGYIHDMQTQQFAEFIHGMHYWTFCVGSLYPPDLLDLNPMFMLAVKKFPQVIVTEHDKTYAMEFTQTFGQFFVYRAYFGAKLDFNSAISMKLVKSYSKEWTFTQAGLSFHYYLFNVSAGGFEDRTKIHIDQDFLENSNANTSFYGGDPSLADVTKLSLWVESLDQNLYPLNATFIPIWTLVSDPLKQQTMKNFMISYLRNN